MAKNNFTDYAGYCDYYTSNDFIAHYGVKGMKWGVRRYQNPDGSLTDAGKAHYGLRELTKQLPQQNQEGSDTEYNKFDKYDADKARPFLAYGLGLDEDEREIYSSLIKRGFHSADGLYEDSLTKRSKVGTKTIDEKFWHGGDKDAKTQYDALHKNSKAIIQKATDYLINESVNDIMKYGQNRGYTKQEVEKRLRKEFENNLDIYYDTISTMFELGYTAEKVSDLSEFLGDHYMNVDWDVFNNRPHQYNGQSARVHWE